MDSLHKFAQDLSGSEMSFDEALDTVSYEDLEFLMDKEAAIRQAAGVIKGMIGKGTQYMAGNAVRDGALVGGAAGAVSGLVDPGFNPYTGQNNSRLGAMVNRGLKGAVVGGGAVMGSRVVNPVMQGQQTWGQAGQAALGTAAKAVGDVSARVNKAAKTVAKKPPTPGA